MAKSFKAAPKRKPPSPDTIAAFEAGGPGTDTKAVGGRKVVRAVNDPEPTKRLSVDLPANKHRRFKTACSATGNKMVAEIEAFIDGRIRELEAESGISRK